MGLSCFVGEDMTGPSLECPEEGSCFTLEVILHAVGLDDLNSFFLPFGLGEGGARGRVLAPVEETLLGRILRGTLLNLLFLLLTEGATLLTVGAILLTVGAILLMAGTALFIREAALLMEGSGLLRRGTDLLMWGAEADLVCAALVVLTGLSVLSGTATLLLNVGTIFQTVPVLRTLRVFSVRCTGRSEVTSS